MYRKIINILKGLLLNIKLCFDLCFSLQQKFIKNVSITSKSSDIIHEPETLFLLFVNPNDCTEIPGNKTLSSSTLFTRDSFKNNLKIKLPSTKAAPELPMKSHSKFRFSFLSDATNSIFFYFPTRTSIVRPQSITRREIAFITFNICSFRSGHSRLATQSANNKF